MKTKLLALLLCFVLVASLFLMSACNFGKKKGNDSTSTEAPAADVEVTDEQARQLAIAAFLKGVDAIRKGGIVFTGTLTGSSTEKVNKDESENEDAEPEFKTENFDFSLNLKYNDEKFYAVATASEGKFEAYYDGELFALLSTEGEDVGGTVFFLDDFVGEIPFVPALVGEGEDYSVIIDKVLALFDLDKIAANVTASSAGVVTIKTNGTTYTVSVSSDAMFDAAVGIVNALKDSGDKPASALFDALLGAGSFAKLQATLEKYSGTDTLDTVLPDLEQVLTDLGIKVDALYEFIAPFLGIEATEELSAGQQVKAFATSTLAEMTVNDALGMAMNFFGMGEKEPEGYDEGAVEPLQSEGPGAEPAAEEEEEIGMTYEAIVAMILGYAEMNVNDLIPLLDEMDEEPDEGEEEQTPVPFDIATEVAPALEYIAALKEAIKLTVSVTCDARLNPTNVALSLVIDTTGLPEDLQDEGEVTQINLTINAEIKSNVDITPSEAMQAKIAAEEAARADIPAEEEEEEGE